MARIVAIEDSPVLQRLLALTMRDTSVEIDPYLDGSGGLEAALANPPVLIVLDLGLPDMSGVAGAGTPRRRSSDAGNTGCPHDR